MKQPMEQIEIHSNKKARFDGTVTLGNILTMVGMIATIGMLWHNLDSRVLLMEERLSVQTRLVESLADAVKRWPALRSDAQLK